MKKETIKNIIGLAVFYTVLIAGVLFIDWRMDQIEDTKNTTAETVVMNERAVK
jgi:hypothetical protein